MARQRQGRMAYHDERRRIGEGFGEGRFAHLPLRDRAGVLRLIAQAAEQAYRRGFCQGVSYSHTAELTLLMRDDLRAWELAPPLDVSPCADLDLAYSSVARLACEHREALARLGLDVPPEFPDRTCDAGRDAPSKHPGEKCGECGCPASTLEPCFSGD